MKKKSAPVIFLVVPEKGNSLSFTLTARTLKLMVFFLVLFLAALVAFIVYYQRISQKFLVLNGLAEQNRQLQQDNQALRELQRTVEDIYAREDKIRALAKDYYRQERAPVEAAATPVPMLVTEKEIDEFIKQVLKQKNLDYIGQHDQSRKQQLLMEAVPNIMPVDGWITNSFQAGGGDTAENHAGIDIAAAAGTPVKAAADGVVVFSGWRTEMGYTIEINHSYGFKTVYGHNSRLAANKGDLVKRGGIIAFSGNTGRSSAPHLHYEVIKNGVNQDPVLFILK
jgi:murein DD-endopeptidase MepM/ murein hydrolase activator NlpD